MFVCVCVCVCVYRFISRLDPLPPPATRPPARRPPANLPPLKPLATFAAVPTPATIGANSGATADKILDAMGNSVWTPLATLFTKDLRPDQKEPPWMRV